MNDIFSPYERGLEVLLTRLGRTHPRYPEALILQSRLLENIRQVRRYGDSEARRADRAQVLDALNGLVLDTLGTSFNELCEQAPDVETHLLHIPTSRELTDQAVVEPSPAGVEGDERGSEGPPPTGGSVYEDLLPCPFVAGPMITDRRIFVGRAEELEQIATRMESAQPISVNVVGERRIGKSSLLYHFFQTWEQRVHRPGRYLVAYLSLQSAAARTRGDFYCAVAQALLERPRVQQYPDSVTALSRNPLRPPDFEQAMRAFRSRGLLPVLCLDEFEALLRHPDEFDDGFYDSLRTLMNESTLMLVVATQEPLQEYRNRYRLTSRFFNLGHMIRLGELTDEEALALVRLPASTIPGAPEALTPEEQRTALAWGGRHPCRLQLAAYSLCQARLQGKDVSWARREYEVQVENQFGAPAPPLARRLWRVLRYLFWDLPRRLGQLARRTGEAVDDLTNWLLGVLIIAVVILVLVGVLSGRQLLDLLHGLLGR